MNSKTPLDAFIENLRPASHETEEQQCPNTHTSVGFSASRADSKCEDHSISGWKTPHDSSLPLHTHTSSTFSRTDAEMECETKCEGALTLPEAPLQPGWLVTYRDRRGVLCGGCDDLQHGTVDACWWEENGWTLCLTDGQEMSLSQVRSVGQTDKAGQIVAAWTVKEHGYDGQGTEKRRSKTEGK